MTINEIIGLTAALISIYAFIQSKYKIEIKLKPRTVKHIYKNVEVY